MTSPDHGFIELDYTGRADGAVFDTTRKEHAHPGMRGPFAPAVVKLGSGQLIPGLDAFLAGKQPGPYRVELAADQAFGKKRADLIKLMPLASFGKDARKLAPGMPITVGEMHGTVKSVGGGRVVVDFNHPLAGQAVTYDIHHHGAVTDPVKKVRSVLKAMLGTELPVLAKDGAVIVKLPKGFPSEGLVSAVEKHTGVTVTVTVTVEEIEIKAHQHVHADGTVHDNSAHKH
jgi:FKBP-type peptidyl-prolyl cis-trans isomerase 2